MDSQSLREQFPVLRRVAYLNSGTCGPVPEASVAAATSMLRLAADEGRGKASFERRQELTDKQRSGYASLLGCPPEEVALTTSTTDGVNIALNGLELGPGDEIVTSDTEHPGVNGPLQSARDLRGVSIKAVPLSDVADAVGPATKAVVCSHVSWMTGEVAPAALAQVDVPVVLDGAQGIGAVPIDLAGLGCDVYAGSGQKWLCGAEGTGMLWISPAIADRIAPIRRSWLTFEDANLGLDAVMHTTARRYDSAAHGNEGIAASVAAFDVLAAAGWDEVQARARDLATSLVERLTERGREVAPRADTTLVSWHEDDAEATRDRLVAAGVAVRNLPGHPLVRASVGAWNDESDLERLLAALG